MSRPARRVPVPARSPSRAGSLAAALAAALLLGACEPGAAPTPPAAPDAPQDAAGRDVLDRIVRAESSVAYHGLRTVSRGPKGASRETRLRLVHGTDGRTFVEWSPLGEGSRRRWTTGSRHAWVRRPELLLRNYRVVEEAGPAEPVAWRETRRVRIEGRRPGRPSLELLVDAATSIVLAETGRTFDGEEWTRARFETFELGEPAEPAPAGEGDGEELASTCGAEPPAGLVPLEATVLPAGFELLCARGSCCGTWTRDYGDGLAAVSVGQRPAGPSDVAGEVRRSRSPGGVTLTGTVHGVAATVSGNLPEAELLAVWRGLAPGAPSR